MAQVNCLLKVEINRGKNSARHFRGAQQDRRRRNVINIEGIRYVEATDAGPAQRREMSPYTEFETEVSGEGPNVRSRGAHHANLNVDDGIFAPLRCGCYGTHLELRDRDSASFELHFLAGPHQGIRSSPIDLDGTHRAGNLFDLTRQSNDGIANSALRDPLHLRCRRRSQTLAFGVIRRRGDPEANRCHIFLVEPHDEREQSSGGSQTQHQQACRHRIESSRMPDFAHIGLLAGARDDIVTGQPLRLVNEQDAVGLSGRRFWHLSIIVVYSLAPHPPLKNTVRRRPRLSVVQRDIIDWYEANGRDLPWRQPDFTPWGALVSEFMLQQTPVARVIPRLEEWLARWPTPASLAAATAGDAVRAWANLGYPRRALWLHACAVTITRDFGGVVPHDVDALLSLPGVGSYTARAVAVFAFGAHEPVVDTNIRRVIARHTLGQAEPGPPREKRDMETMRALLPGPELSPTFNIGVMELGALVCTARSPRCEVCPISATCAWRSSGYPTHDGPIKARQKKYEGSDRQARGAILATLRASAEDVSPATIDRAWADGAQRGRALAGLLSDGLIELSEEGLFRLPL